MSERRRNGLAQPPADTGSDAETSVDHTQRLIIIDDASISSPNGEHIASATIPDGWGGTWDREPITVALLRDDVGIPEDYPFAPLNLPDENLDATVVHEPARGVGKYLGLAEISGFDEDTAMDSLAGTDELEVWQNQQETLTQKDRRLRLLDFATEADDLAQFYDPILEQGEWRGSGVTGDAKQYTETLLEKVSQHPNKCYSNAKRALRAARFDDRVEYVEGIVLNRNLGGVVGHGWIEVDGQVSEVTLPWNMVSPPEETMYFGVSLDEDTLKSAPYDPWYRGGPILLDGSKIE